MNFPRIHLPFIAPAPTTEVKEGPMKLSDAILRGHHKVPESRGVWEYCAIGAAAAELGCVADVPSVAIHLDVPVRILYKVSTLHMIYGIPRRWIAYWLKFHNL